MIAIHQPEFLPWLGFFDKMNTAEQYVIFDHVQFKRRYYENRNRIKQGNQPQWITLPVKAKGNYLQAINNIEIDNSVFWQRKMLGSLRHCYGHTHYFNEYAREIETLINIRAYDLLIDFNMAWIEWFRERLAIETPLCFSSELDVTNYRSSELIIEICKRMGANQYLCGPSGKAYLQIEAFCNAGIEVVWQEFVHPEYPQSGSEFLPYLSTLDLVLNCGSDSRKILFNFVENKK